jgi:hypothetical protein
MNINKSAILSFVLFFGSLTGRAQRTILSAGSASPLLIKGGTVFSADSLVLTPGADFMLAGNTIRESSAAVGISPAPGIQRAYYLGSQINFTGTIQLYYQPAELNGNVESTLQYTDSSTGGAWLAELASTVNTASHYVQLIATAQTFIAATASGQVSILPVSLISFTGNWNAAAPALQWVVAQTDETVNFDVESSPDGVSWTSINHVNGLGGNGTDSYLYTDNDPPSLSMFYRIILIGASGQPTYSNIIKLQKEDNSNTVRLVVGGGSLSVVFSGKMPTAIRIINISGQVLRTDMTSRQEYDFNGLLTGVYFLQYELNGKRTAREFVIL